jgi:GGDEF domain-containing protein
LSLAVLDLRALPSSPPIAPRLHGRVGKHLAEAVRRTDMVGRIGPSSYAVFFHSTGPRPALIAAGRIAEALRGDDGLMSSLSFSLGVSGWECEGPLCLTTLLAQAGEASSEAATIAPDRAFVYL